MGIGTLGFLKGATRTGLDSIEAREEAEREIQKQKQLEELRARLKKEAELATVSDVQYESRDGVTWRVGYNSDGHKVKDSERPATQFELDTLAAEKEKVEYDKKKQTLDLRKIEVGIENDEDQIRSRRVRDNNDTRSTNAQVASYGWSGRSGGSSSGSSGGKVSLSAGVDAILARNSKAIEQLSRQEGVPISVINQNAWDLAERLGPTSSPAQLERAFGIYLNSLRTHAQKQGKALDRYKSPKPEDE